MALSASQIESLSNGLAGALGASIGCFCVAPLGLIVQMKTTGGKGGSSEKGLSADKLSVLSILGSRIQSDGFLGLWRGEWMNAIGNFQSKFGFFFCYSVLKQWHEARWGAMGKLVNVVIGYFAKLLPLPLVYPPQVLTNRMQTSATSIGPRGALKQVLDQQGARGLWTGAESYVILAIWPALEQAIYDQIKVRTRCMAVFLPCSTIEDGRVTPSTLPYHSGLSAAALQALKTHGFHERCCRRPLSFSHGACHAPLSLMQNGLVV